MKVEEIIIKYLKENGYDGLAGEEECGCSLDDFIPCGGESICECEAGYSHECPKGHEVDFIITTSKENPFKSGVK